MCRFEGVRAHIAGGLRRVVESEGGRGFDVVISPIAEGVVLADNRLFDVRRRLQCGLFLLICCFQEA